MNKKLAFLSAVLMAAVGFAGMENVVITFQSAGPDKYLDGTTVVDGEYYALVWTPSGATFAGINANGTAVAPSKVVLKAPLAKDGKCPFVQFEVDEAYAKKNFPGGSWCVCLLDTRRYKTDEKGLITAELDGVGGASVNGYGEVAKAEASVSNMSAISALAGKKAKIQSSFGGLKIDSCQVVDGNFVIHVKGADPSLRVALKSSASLEKTAKTDQVKYGADDLWFATPANENSKILSVEVQQ